jgi:BlaI family penicillinase repressor
MRPPSKTLTPHELEIMKLVWERETTTVRDVYEALLAQRRIAYTSVMTMMNVLERKGHLRKRAAEGRTFVYEPTRSKRDVVGSLVRDFVSRVFDGSAEPLLVHLVEEKHVSDKDLQSLVRRIRRARDDR